MAGTTANWIVLGTSPSAKHVLEHLYSGHINGRIIITTNGGYHLLKRCSIKPTMYYVGDGKAIIDIYRNDIFHAYADNVQILTQYDKLHLFTANQLPWDVCLNCTPFFNPRDLWNPGFSGLLCVHHAIRCGAKSILLIGMDGYNSTMEEPVSDYYDGSKHHLGGAEKTESVVIPFYKKMIEQYPKVDFEIIGKPTFHIDHPQWIEREMF